MARPRKHPATSEAEIRALAAEGLTFPQMAEKLNVPIGALRTTASVLGIKSGRRQESNMPALRWVDELAAGATLDELGKAHGRGVSRQAIYVALQRRGLPTNMRAAIKWKTAQQASKQAGA